MSHELNLQHLHPEVMSVEDLKTVLLERCIKLKNMNRLNKEELVAVFHRVVVPKSQRSCFRENKDPNSGGRAAKPLINILKRENDRMSNCINFERKKIRLNTTSEPSKPLEGQREDEKTEKNEKTNSPPISTVKTPVNTPDDTSNLRRKVGSDNAQSLTAPTKRARIVYP